MILVYKEVTKLKVPRLALLREAGGKMCGTFWVQAKIIQVANC